MPCYNRAWPTCSACEHQGSPSPESRHHPRSRARGQRRRTQHTLQGAACTSQQEAPRPARHVGRARQTPWPRICATCTRARPRSSPGPLPADRPKKPRAKNGGGGGAPPEPRLQHASRSSGAPCRRQRCTPRCPRPHDTARSHAGAFPSPRPRLRRGSGTACGRSRPAPGTPAQSGSLSAS